jgi:uncharacterized protein (DUF2164 family)
MAITLEPEKRERCLNALKDYLRNNLDVDVGDLKAGLLLDHFLKDVAPVVYNRAVRDARKYMEERLVDIDGSCFEIEFPDDRR